MKQRFVFGTVIGIDCLQYLTQKGVDAREFELITIASCAGPSFAITNAIPEGESEDIEYLIERSHAQIWLYLP